MDDAAPDALADVAYGLFEHILNKGLEKKGQYLFTRVERSCDFKDDFYEIFREFSEDYPQLAEALIMRFGSADAIYQMIISGEGIIPSRTTQMYWIVQDAPDSRPDAIEDELAGKWLIFLPADQVDEAWIVVRDATVADELGISTKVSTAKENPESRDNKKVIYVYTKDWRDEGDVMRVRERLRDLGFIDRIGYKRNIETFRGEYSQKGKRVTYYSA
jgi:nuclear transport factor 2 (NTF2) superfamily protein